MGETGQKGWWSRHWKWVVPVGCFTCVVMVVAAGVGIVALVFGLIRSSDVCTQAVARARASTAVVAELGSPIEEGFLVTGNISVSGPSGNADLAIPISGPKGKAVIYATATRSMGKWQFTDLEVAVKGSGTRINLLAAEADSP